MSGRSAGVYALTAQCTSAQTSHVGLGSRFVQEDQARRVEPALEPMPFFASLRDVGSVLFACSERLFLYVSPILTSTTWMA